MAADELLVFVEQSLPDAVSFTVLINDVADEREERNEDDGHNCDQDDRYQDHLGVVGVHGFLLLISSGC